MVTKSLLLILSLFVIILSAGCAKKKDDQVKKEIKDYGIVDSFAGKAQVDSYKKAKKKLEEVHESHKANAHWE